MLGEKTAAAIVRLKHALRKNARIGFVQARAAQMQIEPGLPWGQHRQSAGRGGANRFSN
jgi:hypothetical protein